MLVFVELLQTLFSLKLQESLVQQVVKLELAALALELGLSELQLLVFLESGKSSVLGMESGLASRLFELELLLKHLALELKPSGLVL